MEHIRQFDWCYSQPDIYFLKEDDMAHSVTEKILRNKFRNPAISSESDEDGASIDWDEIFTTKQNSQFGKTQRVYVPCLPPFPPPYPKLSAIDGRQQYQCIKVICAENPHILPEEFVPRPTKGDHRVFEELKEKYEKEQKEYIEWAKTMWTTSHCVRALHPKPHVEAVYEAKLKMRAHEMSCYPKTYAMAAQIPLETCGSTCEMVLDKDLKRVNIKSLPQIECRPLTQKLTIIRPCNMPEPCAKHPCKFILPNEKSVSILPLTEVQRELAQYALDNDAHYVASENALKCLVEHERPWDLGIAVCPTIGPDGETTNIVVLGSEYSVRKEAVLMRTYRAFRYLLQHSLIPPSEKSKLNYKDPDDNTDETSNENDETNGVSDSMAVDSDDDDNSLCIDEDIQNLFDSEDDTGQDETHGKNNDDKQNDETHNIDDDKRNDETHSNGDDKGNDESHSNSYDKEKDETHSNGDGKENVETHSNGDDKENVETHSNGDDKGNYETHSNSDDIQNNETNNSTGKNTSKSRNPNHMKGDSDDFYSCTCKDTIFERPPPRSFRKWRVKNKTTHETYDVIVHCAHKVRDSNGEVILEPIPEYQLDLGGSAPSKGRIRSLALSLHLRNNASLRIVRVAGDTGEVATCESVTRDELQRRHGDAMAGVADTLHTALNQLQGLLPGNYLLHHKAGHGKNALLYAAKPPANATFTLQFDSTKLEDPDESKSLKTPPTLEPVLLPFHKFRKFLPCAFTPHQHMMPREPRRPPQRQKTPPRALQWPKRKRKRKNT